MTAPRYRFVTPSSPENGAGHHRTIPMKPARRRNRRSFSFPNCRLREIERAMPLLDLKQISDLLPEVACTLWMVFS